MVTLFMGSVLNLVKVEQLKTFRKFNTEKEWTVLKVDLSPHWINICNGEKSQEFFPLIYVYDFLL